VRGDLEENKDLEEEKVTPAPIIPT